MKEFGINRRSSTEANKLAWSDERRKAWSEKKKELFRNNPEYREKVLEGLRLANEKVTKQDRAARMKQTAKKLWEDPDHRAKMKQLMKKLWEDPDHRAKMSKISQERWDNPEYRSAMLEIFQHPTYKQFVSEFQRALWSVPEYHIKQQMNRTRVGLYMRKLTPEILDMISSRTVTTTVCLYPVSEFEQCSTLLPKKLDPEWPNSCRYHAKVIRQLLKSYWQKYEKACQRYGTKPLTRNLESDKK